MARHVKPADPPARSTNAALLEAAGGLLAAAGALASDHAQAAASVRESYERVVSRMVARELSSIPVSRLRDITSGALRLSVIEKYYVNVQQLCGVSQATLRSLPGVGDMTASQVVAATRTMSTTIRDGFKLRIDLDPNDSDITDLLRDVAYYGQLDRAAASVLDDAQRVAQELPRLIERARPATFGRLRSAFVGRRGREDAATAVTRLQRWLAWAGQPAVAESFEAAALAARSGFMSRDEVWDNFARRSAEFYGTLGQVVDLHLDVGAAQGYLPEEVVAQVDQQHLDTALLQVGLRGYQVFGAKFALVQQRVIIGDEMGLGKTIQALAVMCHLAAGGQQHALVVCPASVLVNWTREISHHTRLDSCRVHGPDALDQWARWQGRGGVAVTTFDTLRRLPSPGHELAVVVVDEAHYVKNPAARRSQAVASLAARTARVVFLTGTPMENRVEEFCELVRHLKPDIAARLDARHALAGPDAFSRAVAPVYLRRNQEDVLTELPDLLEIQEWEEFGAQEAQHYAGAVAGGNFMAMRRAAFEADPLETASKMNRLLEICVEAAQNGHKVIVFSYFRDVLDKVAKALGSAAFGPLTGSVPAAQRQDMVDAFATAEGPAVLVAQIQAGGVGLNIQAANVVVICEPQVKPSIESQAIARAHRMGQVRAVQVHRLLVEDSVDQRMLEILGQKSLLFDEFARRSDLAAASPDAVDISETALAKAVVEAEQERLARAAMAAQSTPTYGTGSAFDHDVPPA